MPPAQPPAMRIKSTWFKPGVAKSPSEQASAMGFIVFRVAHQMLKRMRSAGFDIDAGAPYMKFLEEVLVFLVSVVDRTAYERLDPSQREAFLIPLVHHVSRHLAENQREYLGEEGGVEARYEDRFVDRFNELASHYAEFGADTKAEPSHGFEPDFAYVRYLGSRLESVLPAKDRHWVIDQVMAVEVPEALGVVQRSMRELFEPGPRRARRAAVSGE